MPSGTTSLPMPSPGMTAIRIAFDFAAPAAIRRAPRKSWVLHGRCRALGSARAGGRFFHKPIVPGLGAIDAGAGDFLVKLLEKIERALAAVGADDAVLGIDLQIGLYRRRVKRL